MLTIISDVHGCNDEYLAITSKTEFSVQVGDMGFSYDHLDQLNPTNHKMFQGNHENFIKLEEQPPKHYLGRFGSYELNGIKFFWIGGADSVDKQYRIEGRDWFRNEQLSFKEQKVCYEMYMDIKPDLVLSHDCPESVKHYFITNDWKIEPSDTNLMLQVFFHVHKPKLWVFAHHHVSYRVEYEGTQFICLNELCHVDISKNNGEYVVSETKGTPYHESCKRNQLKKNGGRSV
jgi:hypothetical protein